MAQIRLTSVSSGRMAWHAAETKWCCAPLIRKIVDMNEAESGKGVQVYGIFYY